MINSDLYKRIELDRSIIFGKGYMKNAIIRWLQKEVYLWWNTFKRVAICIGIYSVYLNGSYFLGK